MLTETLLPSSLLPRLSQIFELDGGAGIEPTRPAWLDQPALAHQLLDQLCPVSRVVDAFKQTLVQPVQHGEHQGGHFATVLGVYLFHLDVSGIVLTWRWSNRGPIPVDEHQLALQNIVSDPDWLMQSAQLLGGQLFQQARQQAPLPRTARPVPPTAKTYAQWLTDQIAHRLLTPTVVERTQHLVQQALGLNGTLLAKADQLPAREPLRRSASVGNYNLMVKSAPRIEQIKKDAPLIANLYPLFCDAADFVQGLEPAAALKRFLIEHGLDQATWRAICAMGTEPLTPLLMLYEGSRDKAMLDLLKCLCGLRIRRAAQLWALAHLFSTYGAHRSRPLQYFNSVDGDPVLVHILACCPQTLSPNQQELDELDLVIRWAMDEHIGQPDKRQRQAGWGWLVRQATHWRSREQVRLQSTKLQWFAPIEAVSIEQFTFEALQSELALWDEALALHHCADVYGHRCRDGAYLIYSVRYPAIRAGSPNEQKTGKRIATLALSRLGPRWTIDQLVGPANTGVAPAVEQASLILVNLLNQLPAPKSQGLQANQRCHHRAPINTEMR